MKIVTVVRNSAGFTLMELMIVVSIIGILLAIVMPNYSESVRKSRRADAMKELMELGAMQERFYAQNSTYTTEIEGADGLNLERTITSEGYYRLKSEACPDKDITTCYLLTATPMPTTSQVKDTQCATLSLDRLGNREGSGTLGEKCW